MNFSCFIQSSLYHKQSTWGYHITEFNLPYDAWEYKTLEITKLFFEWYGLIKNKIFCLQFTTQINRWRAVVSKAKETQVITPSQMQVHTSFEKCNIERQLHK